MQNGELCLMCMGAGEMLSISNPETGALAYVKCCHGVRAKLSEKERKKALKEAVDAMEKILGKFTLVIIKNEEES